MSWTIVAQKDIRDAGRSKVLWGVTLLFILFAAGMAYLYSQVSGLQQGGANSALSSIGLISFLQTPIGLLVPIIGLLLGYKAVAGEVESGSMKLLLSLPHSRSNVVLGKFIGRLSVLTVAIVIGFAVATAVVLALYPEISPEKYALFILLTIVFGGAYVSIGIGISALTKSTAKAGASIFGVFFLFNILWVWIGRAINWAVNGSFFFTNPLNPPDWFIFYTRLSPNGAFNGVLQPMLDLPPSAQGIMTPDSTAFYFSTWFTLCILIVWVVLPAGIGYLRFHNADL